MKSNGSQKEATGSTRIDAHLLSPFGVKNMRGSSMLRERRHRGQECESLKTVSHLMFDFALSIESGPTRRYKLSDVHDF
ncbi:hypothetical protein Y032_0531g3021 [Ancylostoma ceylanicum]|uniref:Uncharacterized protein n=1 Tax=Ancylostoma ceylanicum TaxID=53326 RepID=A0A016WTS8_9BILA|nr:hypothetical protein Y032_0531g3021 [Ancylostoma ceylanicum]